eukprot:COSAG05_NODE_2104_length_3554_cov_6.450362_6_plen_66_part_00
MNRLPPSGAETTCSRPRPTEERLLVLRGACIAWRTVRALMHAHCLAWRTHRSIRMLPVPQITLEE